MVGSASGTKPKKFTPLVTSITTAHNSNPVKVLADTGCDTSVITQALYESHFADCEIDPSDQPPLNSASGPIYVAGVIRPTIQFKGKDAKRRTKTVDLQVAVYVATNMIGAGALLGTDIWKPAEVQIDFKRDLITFPNHGGVAVPCTALYKRTHVPVNVVSAENVRIRAGTRRQIRIKPEQGSKPLATYGQYSFEPSGRVFEERCLPSVFDSTYMYIAIHNPADQDWIIPKGTAVGTGYPVVESRRLPTVDEANRALELMAKEGSDPPDEFDVDIEPPPDSIPAEERNLEEPASFIPVLDSAKKLDNGVSVNGPPDQCKRIEELVHQYKEIWEDNGTPADVPIDMWMTVPTKEGASFPKRVKQYSQTEASKKVIDEIFDKLHAQGRMEFSTRHTPTAYPVFVVWTDKVVDGKVTRKGRVVVDLRTLNNITEPDLYPVQQQEDMLMRISGKKYLSAMDAASFFYQWRIHPRHRHKMAVISHRGQELFRVAIMGYVNSVAYVSRMMANILRGLDFVVVYVDDIIVYSDTFEEHIRHLEAVLRRLREYNITISPGKTFLGFHDVDVLGQRVTSLGLTTTERRTEALVALEFPRTLKHLEHYLGLTSYLRKFIPHYAAVVKPLQDRKSRLLKLSPAVGGPKRQHYVATTEILEPTPEELEAYHSLQAFWKTGVFLHHFRKDSPLFIAVDASKESGIGAVVFHADQEWLDERKGDYSEPPPATTIKPIVFLSRELRGPEYRYWVTAMEVTGIKWAMQKVKFMIDAAKQCIVYTDHASAKQKVEQSPEITANGGHGLKITADCIYIRGFPNVTLYHVPGKHHVIPDALSRLPHRIQRTRDTLYSDLMDDTALPEPVVPETVDNNFDFELPEGKVLLAVRTRSQISKEEGGRPVQPLPLIDLPTIKEMADFEAEKKKNPRAIFRRKPASPIPEDEIPLPPENPELLVPAPDPADERQLEKQACTEEAVQASPGIIANILEGYSADTHLAKIIQDLVELRVKYPNERDRPNLPYSLDDKGLLWLQMDNTKKLCIPRSMFKLFFEEAHSRAHLGFDRSLQRLHPYALHKGAKGLKAYCDHCPICLTQKTRRHKPYGELQPILEPFIPFHTITIDIVTALPQGIYNAMLSMTDKATKRVTFIPGQENHSAEDWGDAIDQRLAEADWGYPRKVIADRDPRWTAAVWRRIWSNRGTKLAFTTAYHAMSDGQSEATNQVAEIALRHFISEMNHPTEWHKALPYIQVTLNSAINRATGSSPHRLMYGISLPTATEPLTDRIKEALGHKGEREDAKSAVAHGIMAMKRQFDRKHTPLRLQKGDKVVLRIGKGYNTPLSRRYPKISERYVGPIEILEKVGNLAYRIKVPNWLKGIHDVVSVSHLEPVPKATDPFKRYTCPPAVVQEVPIESDEIPYERYELQAIRASKWEKSNGKWIPLYQVVWKGWPPNADLTWYGPEWVDEAPELVDGYWKSLPEAKRHPPRDKISHSRRRQANAILPPVDYPKGI